MENWAIQVCTLCTHSLELLMTASWCCCCCCCGKIHFIWLRSMTTEGFWTPRNRRIRCNRLNSWKILMRNLKAHQVSPSQNLSHYSHTQQMHLSWIKLKLVSSSPAASLARSLSNILRRSEETGCGAVCILILLLLLFYTDRYLNPDMGNIFVYDQV